MGWLFGRKKKVPKVPFPEGHPVGEQTLQFPSGPSSEKVIEPDKVKEAAGVVPEPVPKSEPVVEQEAPMPPAQQQVTPRQVEAPVFESTEPLFVKKDVYERILGEFEELKHDLGRLSYATKTLEESEYNEEHNFEKLKKAIKILHDKLLSVDKTIYKVQG